MFILSLGDAPDNDDEILYFSDKIVQKTNITKTSQSVSTPHNVSVHSQLVLL